MVRLPRTRFKGQTMQIIALLVGLGVLLGLVAIAIDGGSALLQRRTMQNAADAGAIAGATLMQQNVVGTCLPATSPCHPSYTILNNSLLDRVNALAGANRGGTLGATDANYLVTVEYHFDYLGGPSLCPGGVQKCYKPAPPYDPNQFILVPDFADGIRVTSHIDNPNSGFSKSLPVPLLSVPVSGRAAVQLFPTCPTPAQPGKTLPFVRFRPSLERQFWTLGNDVCHPFPFWTSNSDISVGSFKNVVSFNTRTTHDIGFTRTDLAEPVQTLLANFDFRHPTSWEHGNYAQNQTPPEDPGCPSDLTKCADMTGSNPAGSNDLLDAQNFLYWGWQGQLSFASLYDPRSETTFPADRTNNFGRFGTPNRTGDWAEILNGNLGNNIMQPLHDYIVSTHSDAITTDLSTSLNWGPAIIRTVYVWGEPECPAGQNCAPNLNYSDGKSAQTWVDNVPVGKCNGNPQDPKVSGWEDVTISEKNNGTFVANDTLCSSQALNLGDRLRITNAYTFIFYANLQGTNYPIQNPTGCNVSNQRSNSTALGFLASQDEPGPNPGQCGWLPGSGVFIRQIDPGP